VIDIPEELAATQERYNGDRGREFIARLPTLTEDFLERWDFQAYIEQYRRGREHSRRGSL